MYLTTVSLIMYTQLRHVQQQATTRTLRTTEIDLSRTQRIRIVRQNRGNLYQDEEDGEEEVYFEYNKGKIIYILKIKDIKVVC